jgi:hypothetical protein
MELNLTYGPPYLITHLFLSDVVAIIFLFLGPFIFKYARDIS